MGWFAKRLGGSGGGVHTTIAALEGAIARAAAGAARTSARLGSVTAQLGRTREALGEMLTTSGELNDDIRRIHESASHTDTAAAEMKRVAGEGRTLGRESEQASHQLQSQMRATVERIDRLFADVQAVVQVSKVIDDIARQTQLLAFNASIEAARAGEHGLGFAVVAREVGMLSQGSTQRTHEIKSLLERITAELGPARDAMGRSEGLVESAAGKTQALVRALERLATLSDDVSAHMGSIAGAVDQQRTGIGDVVGRLKAATDAVGAIGEDAKAMVGATEALSQLTEETFQHFAILDTGSLFHGALMLSRELARETERLFGRTIDAGRITLADALACDYREIRGAEIATLGHIFDVRRVPAGGFDPPKYRTRYDAAIEVELAALCDAIKAREPRLRFLIVIDLNAYAPTHNSEHRHDWTGNREADLAGNRAKRFFHDQPVLVRGARIGMPQAERLGNRASREDFVRAGCDLAANDAARQACLVQTYARDIGTIVTALTIPVFVKGERWGAVLAGWNA